MSIRFVPKENIHRFGNELDSNRLKFITQDENAHVVGPHDERMKVAEGYEEHQEKLKGYALDVITKAGATVFGPVKAIADVVQKYSSE